MNDKFTNNPNKDEATANKLNKIADQTNPNSYFVSELEQKLIEKHQPRKGWSFSFKQAAPVFGWAVLIAALVFFLNGTFSTLIPTQQPGANTTPGQFVCPVTQPNGSTPPGETTQDANYLGNGELWTALWPDGKIYMSPNDQRPDGSLSMKWGFWRGIHGALTVEGHRLDAKAEPLRVDIPDGYGDTGFQVLGLYFPTTGCWEITGYVGGTSLTFVTEVLYDTTSTPTPPEPVVVTSVVTAPPTDGGYDWRDTKLFLAQSLPESPADAQVYSLKLNQPVSQEIVLALAQRFGIQGEVFEGPIGITGTSGYIVTVGKQRLEVQPNGYFTFYTEFENFALGKAPDKQARTAIDNFLKRYGFDFEYRIETAPELTAQQDYIIPLTADGAEIRLFDADSLRDYHRRRGTSPCFLRLPVGLRSTWNVPSHHS